MKGGASLKKNALEKEYEEYLNYLYDLASHKYSDCNDIDSLVQETLIAFLIKQKNGERIEHKKGFLSAVFKNKYNEWLRKKYRNNIVSFDYAQIIKNDDSIGNAEESEIIREEYASVRREIGRLLSIYREVTVRYYVHGHSVERIANDLGISVGTVKSRLSSARQQIKEGITKMEKYSEISYSPKYLSTAIWGSGGLSGEPFSLLGTQIEQNILILAYEAPVSVRSIAETMGMPCAYIEPLIERMINGEVMGRTASGLVYSRCFIVKYEDSFGNIDAQEKVAEKYAKKVWETANLHFALLFENKEFLSMSDKQKATICLFGLNMALSSISSMCNDKSEWPDNPPERPNGGRWFAYCTSYENKHVRNMKYDSSGPVNVSYLSDTGENCTLFDKQSFFGNAHWSYGSFKYKYRLQTIARFYASLIPGCGIVPDDARIYELVPDFEKLNIVKRDESGAAILDIPFLTEETANSVFYPATTSLANELFAILSDDLKAIINNKHHKVPKHVDEYKHCETQWLLRAYPLAQLEAIVRQGHLPYNTEIGKTPLIFMTYRKKVN